MHNSSIRLIQVLAALFALVTQPELSNAQGVGQIRFPSQVETDVNPVTGVEAFGRAVALNGEWFVTTERLSSLEPRPRSILHFFRREQAGFVRTQQALPITTYPFYGTPGEVFLRGDTAVFSDFLNRVPSQGITIPRQVFIFDFDGTNWIHVQSLEPFPAGYGQINREFFGQDIRFLGDDTIAVTGQLQTSPVRTEVAIYMFDRTPSGWQGSQVLHEPPYDPLIQGYGSHIGGNESQLVVTNSNGGFYVIERGIQGMWGITGQGITPLNHRYGAAGQTNAVSVDIEGDLLALGTPMEHRMGFPWAPHVGVVEIFQRIAGVWVWETELTASDGILNPQPSAGATYNDQFGISLDIDQGRILVGAYQATTDPNGYPQGNVDGQLGQGQGYLFEKVNGQWQELYRLRRAETGQWDQLGRAVVLDGNTAIVSAIGATAGAATRAGAVQVFNLPMGHTVCVGIQNSTGQAATLEATGWSHISMGDLTLTVANLPPNQTTLFLAAHQNGFFQPAGSQGVLCISGAFARFNRPGEFGPADSAGVRSLQVPTIDIPINPVAPMVAGETWVFQAWYRDQNPMSTSNFTSAVQVTFE